MVLAEGLSNSRLEHLFEHLTTPLPNQPRTPRPPMRGIAPDGRRKCGSVSNAILEVLSEAGSDLRVRDITAAVERLLCSPVSCSSVKSYLHRRSRGRVPIFVQTRRGCYQLRRDR
jgi:hypothetical protein